MRRQHKQGQLACVASTDQTRRTGAGQRRERTGTWQGVVGERQKKQREEVEGRGGEGRGGGEGRRG
eukprot:365674-Hanusia_phi.AAC.4